MESNIFWFLQLSQRFKICWPDKEINYANQVKQDGEANHTRDSKSADQTRTNLAKSRRIDKQFNMHKYGMDMDQLIASIKENANYPWLR